MAEVAPGAREAEGGVVLTWILVPLASRGASMASSDRAYAPRRREGPLDPCARAWKTRFDAVFLGTVAARASQTPNQRKMILTTCAACAAPLAHDAPRCVRCQTRYCNKTCQMDQNNLAATYASGAAPRVTSAILCSTKGNSGRVRRLLPRVRALRTPPVPLPCEFSRGPQNPHEFV